MSVFIQNTDILDPSQLMLRANQYWYTADTRFGIRCKLDLDGELSVHVTPVHNAMRQGQTLTLLSIGFGKPPADTREEVLDRFFCAFPRVSDLFNSLLRFPWKFRSESNTFDAIRTADGVTLRRACIRAENIWTPFVRLPVLATIPTKWTEQEIERVLTNGQFSTLDATVLVGGRDHQERPAQVTGPGVARMLREECNYRIEGHGREVSVQFFWPDGTTLTAAMNVDYV